MLATLAVPACEDTEETPMMPPAATPAPSPIPPPDEPFRGMAPQPGTPTPFVSPPVDHFMLGNGVDVVLVERHTLPTIYWQLEFPGGALMDPPGKEGRSSLCIWLLLGGGRPDTVARLEEMGSQLTVGFGLDQVSLNGFALTQNFDATLDLWAATLAQPGAYLETLNWVRRQSQGRLLATRGSPEAIAGRLLAPLTLGKSHPYARQPTASSYAAINLEDCRQFNQTLRSAGTRLFVAGDISRADVARKFAARLPDRGASAPLPPIPAPAPQPDRIVFADAPGTTQTTIVMWGPGPTRKSPDYYSATVMASIFAGGGLTSRLGADLREKMGSTYSVGGGFSYWKNSGVLLVSAPVAADRTASAIAAMLTDASAMIATDVTDDELHLARDGRITGLAGRFDTVGGALGAFMDLAHYDLPFTFYDDFSARFAAVDAAAVRQAARDYLAPAGLRFVVVGDATTTLPALQTLVTSGPLAGVPLRIVDMDGNPAGP